MIRIATPADAEAIAAVHINAWHETFTELLPAAAFEARGLEYREDQWARLLDDPEVFGKARAYVAEDEAGRTVGFAACGMQRASEFLEQGYEGEVQALYVLRVGQGQGLGRRLMSTMARYLIELKLEGMTLWTLRAGPACGFYERMGGGIVGERMDQRPEAVFDDVAYGWRDLRVLLD